MSIQTSRVAYEMRFCARALGASEARLGQAIAINTSMLIYLAGDQRTEQQLPDDPPPM